MKKRVKFSRSVINILCADLTADQARRFRHILKTAPESLDNYPCIRGERLLDTLRRFLGGY